MPELLEEPIAEVKEPTARVADTGEFSGLAVADETQAEPVIEFHESTPEVGDKLEAPLLSDTISDNTVADESVALLEEPVVVLEEPVAVLEESVAVTEEPIAVVEESVAVTEEPIAVVEEPVAILEEPVAITEEPAAAVAEETSALHDEAGAEHMPFESPSESPGLTDEPIESLAIEEPDAVLEEPTAETTDQSSVDIAVEAQVVAGEVTEIHDRAAQVDEANALV